MRRLLLLFLVSTLFLKKASSQDSLKIEEIKKLFLKFEGLDSSKLSVSLHSGSIVLPHSEKKVGNYNNTYRHYEEGNLLLIDNSLRYEEQRRTKNTVYFFVQEQLVMISTYSIKEGLYTPIITLYVEGDKVLASNKGENMRFLLPDDLEDADKWLKIFKTAK